jgi:hypothetical protein
MAFFIFTVMETSYLTYTLQSAAALECYNEVNNEKKEKLSNCALLTMCILKG